MTNLYIESGMTATEWEKVGWDAIRGTLRAFADSAHETARADGDSEDAFSGYARGFGDASHNFDQVKRGEWGALIERLHQAKKLAGGEYVKEVLGTEFATAYMTAIRSAISMSFAEVNRTDSDR